MFLFAEYLGEIERNLANGDITEETHRPALRKLLESGGNGVVAASKPARFLRGEPRFTIARGETLLGHLETRYIGEDVGAMENAKRPNFALFARYREGLRSWILTNYLEFHWYVMGKKRMTARLAKRRSGGKLKRLKNGEAELANLLKAFLAPKCATTLESTDRQIFHHYGAVAQARMAFQNKCVEMSVTVTSGLAVAVVGAAIKLTSDNHMHSLMDFFDSIGDPFVGMVLWLYVFIQLSLLTNYIYHTFSVLAFDYVYRGILDRPGSKFIPSEAPLTKFKLGCGLVLTNFQASVLYSSSFLGLSALNFISFGTFDPSPPCWLCIGALLESCWLIALILLHSNADSEKGGLCKYLAKDVRRLNDYADDS